MFVSVLCCHVQVTPDGVAARVGKLRPGDRILSVSGVYCMCLSHSHSKLLYKCFGFKCTHT